MSTTSPNPEKSATVLPTSTPKSRSCVVCRRRKVKCDKQSPCSNCRRANIPCVLPSKDRPPKWARRHAAALSVDEPPENSSGVSRVTDRLLTLENLVKELRSQLEEARSTGGGSSGVGSPENAGEVEIHRDQGEQSPLSNAGSIQKEFGRLVLQDAGSSHYVSSGFWSRVNDELDGLKMDTRALAGEESDSPEDEISTPSTQELGRTPSQRHGFLFGHNLNSSAPDLREFHPLPSQIPFLLDVFSESVNVIAQVVHMPSITELIREWRTSGRSLTPSNEALMFSIYYAAITSMEEDEVMTNFGSSKTDLNIKFRLGLEHALAKADFLNTPDITLVQAFALFLCLVRRHDSPRFVWMMTGLLIRMAQYLGLQRDGAHFEHLTPFEVEMRRRIWWGIVMLDIRASEDQGTELMLGSGSFDTKIPLNINDADIDSETRETPAERNSTTDMSFARINYGIGEMTRKLMVAATRDDAISLPNQSLLLNEMFQRLEQDFLPFATEPKNTLYRVGVIIAHLVMAKMTLIVYLPTLFSSPSEQFSDEIRTKLLVSAIEVAEYNHALNAEQAFRKWRWIYQTYTHWYAIVYLMIEISRRPWSPIVERAWVALHSSWLIPAQRSLDKNLRIWVPLRKLMAKACNHREAELSRLRANPQAAMRLELEDRDIALPSSAELASNGSGIEDCHQRWRDLVGMTNRYEQATQKVESFAAGIVDVVVNTAYADEPGARSAFVHDTDNLSPITTFKPTETATQTANSAFSFSDAGNVLLPSNEPNVEPNEGWTYPSFSTVPSLGSVPWLWADSDSSFDVFASLDVDNFDFNMDVDSDINWYDWVESAKGI